MLAVIIETIGGILLIILAKAIFSLDLVRPLKGTAMFKKKYLKRLGIISGARHNEFN